MYFGTSVVSLPAEPSSYAPWPLCLIFLGYVCFVVVQFMFGGPVECIDATPSRDTNYSFPEVHSGDPSPCKMVSFGRSSPET